MGRFAASPNRTPELMHSVSAVTVMHGRGRRFGQRFCAVRFSLHSRGCDAWRSCVRLVHACVELFSSTLSFRCRGVCSGGMDGLPCVCRITTVGNMRVESRFRGACWVVSVSLLRCCLAAQSRVCLTIVAAPASQTQTASYKRGSGVRASPSFSLLQRRWPLRCR